MPRKFNKRRRHRKRPFKRRIGVKGRVNHSKKLDLTIVKAKRNDTVAYVHRGLPMPQHYICMLNSVIEGNAINTDFNTTGEFGFQVKANSIRLPWNTSRTFPAHVLGTGYGASPTGGYLVTTLEPQGTYQLLARNTAGGVQTRGMFDNFRVISSNIIVHASTTTNLNDCWCTVTPFYDNSNTLTNQAPVAQFQSAADVYSKSARITYLTSSSRPQIRNSISIPRLLGLTPRQYVDDSVWQGDHASDPQNSILWAVYFQMLSGIAPVTGLALTLKVEVQYVVEFIAQMAGSLDSQ